MAITFLDEEEDGASPEQEIGTKITFLDEEPETGVTFIEEDPVQSYSSAVKEFKDVQKTYESNAAAYNEFSSLPLTEADEPERLRLFDGARNSEILLDDKLRKVEKLRPAYEAVQEQRKQEEIASLNKLSENPLTAGVVEPALAAREKREAQLAALAQENLEDEAYSQKAKEISEEYSNFVNSSIQKSIKDSEEERLLLRDVLNERNRARMTGLGRVGAAEAVGSVILGTRESQNVADLASELGEEYANEILGRSATPRDVARGAVARFVGGGIAGIPSNVIDLFAGGEREPESLEEVRRLQSLVDGGDASVAPQLEEAKKNLRKEALLTAVERMTPEEKFKIQRDYLESKQNEILAGAPPERRQRIIDASERIMDSYEASRFNPEDPKAYGALLPDGTIYFTPKGKEDVNLAVDKIADAGLISEASKERYKSYYNNLEAERERAIRASAVQTTTFQNWIKNNPEYSIETDAGVEEAIAAFEESHNTPTANIVDIVPGLFRGIKSYVTDATIGARLSAIAASDISESEKADQMLAIYAEETEKLGERPPTSFLGGAAEITGNFAAQALPMIAAKFLSLFGPTGKTAGKFAVPTARAYTLAHMGALYAGQGYIEAVGQSVRESGYNSLEEIQEQNPELAERINETGKRAMIDAAKISLTEQIPIEGLVSSIGKFAKKPTTFKRIMEAVALNPAAEISQEIFADAAMQAAQSRYSLENKDIKMMSLEEIGQMYLGVLPITGGTAVAARTADRAMQRKEDAIAKLNEEQRRIFEAESALIDVAERAAKDAEATAPETAKAVADEAARARQELDARIGQTAESVGGEPISIRATVSPRREGETDQEWRARIEQERAEQGVTIPESRTIADAVRDKDTFVFNGMRGALVKDGDRVSFRPFGTQESYEVPASEAQNISEVEGVEWVRRGQIRTTVQEAPVEVSTEIEATPVVTEDEASEVADDVEVPPSLVEIEKSPTLNFFADLFDTGESRVSQEGKRAKKVSQTPEFYRQVRPEQIDQARKLIDNALRIIDAMDVSDAEKDSLAQGFLLLDQDIDKYEQNKEYQRYRAEAVREVRPTVEAGQIEPTETEAQAAARELEQRSRAEAERLERVATARRVAAGRAAFVPAGQAEALGRVARAESAPDEFESLVEQGFAEEYKGQQVLTEAGIAALPEAQRPRLSPQVRKIQIDTGATDAAAEAISKNLRIGVDQVPPNVRMPEGWTLEGDVYIPPAPQQVTKAPEAAPTPEVSPEAIPEVPTEPARPQRRAAIVEQAPEETDDADVRDEVPALTTFDRLFAFAEDLIAATPEKAESIRKTIANMAARITAMTKNRSDDFRDAVIDKAADRLRRSLERGVKTISGARIIASAFDDVKNLKRFSGEVNQIESSMDEDKDEGVKLGDKLDDGQLSPDVVAARTDAATILESFTPLERAALSGLLIQRNLIDRKQAYEYLQEAIEAGFTADDISNAIDAAEQKFNDVQRGVGRTVGRAGVAPTGQVAPTETRLQQTERSGVMGEVLSEVDKSDNLTPNETAAKDKTNDPTLNKIGSWRNTLPEGPLRDLIDLIISVSPDAANLDIKYVSTLDGRYDGLYDPQTNTLYMPLNPTKDINLLIGHELVHATTLSKAREFDNGNLNALSANDRAVFNGLEKIRQRLIRTMGRGNAKFAEIMRIKNAAERGLAAADAVANGEIDGNLYALVNMAEFLANSIDNDGFKDALGAVDRNILNEIWDLIKRLFTLGGKTPNGVDLVWRSIAQLSTTVEGEGDVSAAAITPQQDRGYLLDAIERGDFDAAQALADGGATIDRATFLRSIRPAATQRATTIHARLEKDGIISKDEFSNERGLVYGDGRGAASQYLGAQSYEPYPPVGFKPTYTGDRVAGEGAAIDKKFRTILNTFVLNVVDSETRAFIVKDIANLLVNGGRAVFVTRGKDVATSKALVSFGPLERIQRSEGKLTYQKGFTQPELIQYLQETLGDGFNVRALRGGSSSDVRAEVIKNTGATLDNPPLVQESIEGRNLVAPSAITPQQDADYLAAVERGDMETAQRMVDAAAKATPYTIGPVYHGGSFNLDTDPVFRVPQGAKKKNKWQMAFGVHFADLKTEAEAYLKEGGKLVAAYIGGGPILDATQKSSGKLDDDLANRFDEKTRNRINKHIGFLSSFVPVKDASGSTVPVSALVDVLDAMPPAQARQALQDAGFSGIAYTAKAITGVKTFRPFTAYVILDSPNNIKSADPVTYDDQGNVIPLSKRFQPTEADIRFAAIDPTKLQKPDDMDSPTQAEASENVANRAEAKKAQLNLLGHSILEDEIPEEYTELTNEDYENGMAFQDFKFSKSYNFNNPTYAPFVAAQWLRLNGGLMPTVKVQGLELSKPEKGTAEAESLRLLKRAVSIYDSRSEVRGGKELTYSLGDIMATWMESGLGEAALRNAIVQFTNLDVSIAEKAAANFAEVYKLAQAVQDAKNRAVTRVERGLPAETARQRKEKNARLKLEQAAGTIDAIAESIKIAFDVNVNKPRTDRATERKQIEEQLRQAKRILRDIVPSQYLGGQLASLEAATGIDGLRKVVEAAQDALGNAMLDNAVARAKNAFIKATKAIKKNEIGPDAAAALREFVENYKTKGMSEETRKKIQEAVTAFDANPVEALADIASEKYRKRAGELDQIRIDKELGLNTLNEISDFVNSVLHADKIARGEMLFNKKQTRFEIIDKSIEEIDKAKNISDSFLVKFFRITQGMRGEAILNALGLETLRKFAYENLVTDAYGDQLSSTHRLKHQIENAIKEITGFEIGSRDFDLYSKELIEVRGVNLSGESGTIKIQRNELWDILGSLRDPDNMRRAVQSGGFVIDRLRTENIDTVKITPDNYIDLLAKATDKDNAMIGFLHGMYNNDLFEILNDSYIQAYGHGIKKVDSYYPRNADWVTRRVESKDDLAYSAYTQTRVDDFGPLKERDERARARLVATDAISRIDYHLENDARIAAYLPISKDIDSVLNDPIIKEKLTKKLGRKGYQIIVEMTRQQMVPTRGLPSGVLSILSTNVGVGVLGLKIHAAMQNPVGIPIAVASYGLEGFKYLAKALPYGVSAVDPAKWRKMANVLKEFAPYYAERYGLGGYAREMTSSIVDVDYRSSKFRKSTEHAALFMLEKTDQWGAYIRYRIAQERIRDTTNLEEGTEEFNRAVAKEWSLIMFRSENTSHGADRTGVFQFAAKHPFAKFFIMFQSAVSKQFSLAAEGLLQIQQGGAKNRREGLSKLGLFFTSVYMSAAISRAFYGFMFPPKDEEEEKKTWLEFFAGMIAAPASAIPVLGNFISTGIENIAGAASGKPDIGLPKPMQIDLISSLAFSSLDFGIALGRFIADLSDQEINEITGNPKYVDSFLRAAKKAASPASMLSGAPIGGGMQLWNLFITKPREMFFAGDEAKRKETTKKIKDKIKAERPEPIRQEVAKLYFAAMENNQKQFARAYKELKAKRKNFSLKDARDYISRREEFIISRLVESGDISIKNGDITREEYLENKALRSATLSAISQMWNDTRLKQAP